MEERICKRGSAWALLGGAAGEGSIGTINVRGRRPPSRPCAWPRLPHRGLHPGAMGCCGRSAGFVYQTEGEGGVPPNTQKPKTNLAQNFSAAKIGLEQTAGMH